MDGGDFLALIRACVIEGEFHDTARAFDADRFDRERRVLADLGLADALDHRLHLALLRRVDIELDARVEILDVLADHHEVDVAARRRRPDTRGPATRRGLSLMAQSVGLTSAIRSGMSFAASGVPRPVTASQPIDAA